MKNKSVLFIMLFSLLSFNTHKAVSLNNSTVRCLKTLIPVNLVAAFASYYLIQASNNQYKEASLVEQSPKENIKLLRNFCANYRKIIYGFRDTKFVHDSSLSLALIDIGDDNVKLQKFASYVSGLMNEKASDKRVYGRYVIPILASLFTGGTIYQEFKN